MDHRGAVARARVFFALWPDPAVRAALAQLALQASAQSGGRAVAAANIHLTLFFVGAIARERIAMLEDAAAAVRARRFVLELDRCGAWLRKGIVWAGARSMPPELSELEARLRASLAPLGFEAEERPYVAHVTLVRKALRKAVFAEPFACRWAVDDFALVESVSVPGGVRYRALARWPLD